MLLLSCFLSLLSTCARHSLPIWLPAPTRGRPASQSHVPKHLPSPTQESQTGSYTPSPAWCCYAPTPPSDRTYLGSSSPPTSSTTLEIQATHRPSRGWQGPPGTCLSCPWQVMPCVVWTSWGSLPVPASYSAYSCQPQGAFQAGGVSSPDEPVGRSHNLMNSLLWVHPLGSRH